MDNNTIPNYEFFLKPILDVLSTKDEPLHRKLIEDEIIKNFKFTSEQKAKTIPSGQNLLRNRIGWAYTYLKTSNLINRPKRGYYKITEEGLKFNSDNKVITVKDLPKKDTEEYNRFYGLDNNNNNDNNDSITESNVVQIETKNTPEEIISQNISIIEEKLKSDLHDELININPYKFESLVVDLIVAMGYGGSREEAKKVTQYSNDEGIDGIINDDRLGLEVIYLQAKRWNGSVGRPAVQAFVGALAGKHANKGIMITTSTFTKAAVDYATNVGQKIILIDGNKLLSLLIEFNIGVSVKEVYTIKDINKDYFDYE